MSVRRVQCQQSVELSGATDSIQIFPPGRHHIVPRDASTKEPLPLDVAIGPQVAARIEACRLAHAEAAARGEGDPPFFDFAHEGKAASGHPTRIFWAGDDPVHGGVRAELAWTGSGRRAVEGKDFTRFSAQFDVDTESGEILSCPVNMGGLVNRAAFRSIAPISAEAADQPSTQHPEPRTQNTETPMPDPKKTRTVQAAEAPAAPAAPEAPAAPAQDAQPAPEAENKPLSADEAKALREELIAAKRDCEYMRAQLDSAQAKIQALEAERQAKLAESAKAAVEAAAADGRIAPAAKERWVQAIAADPKNSELLDALPKHPVTQQVIATGAPPPAEAPDAVAKKPIGLAKVEAAFKAKTK
ncbi:MAG: hypothetical protein IT577_23760 [Verrucomicrobiae bacterium]|nr:hypothetical protein [Verrucomicrobiae bacterium]